MTAKAKLLAQVEQGGWSERSSRQALMVMIGRDLNPAVAIAGGTARRQLRR